jgi:hypothetical protein
MAEELEGRRRSWRRRAARMGRSGAGDGGHGIVLDSELLMLG